MTLLDKFLIGNSFVSLTAHLYVVIKWSELHILKEIRKERNHIIKQHIKAGHKSRLKHCIDEACASLRKPMSVQQELHTEL